MVLSWRRVFCTSIPKDEERTLPIIEDKPDSTPTRRLKSRFAGFFSEPSTPRLHSEPVSTPTLRCRTAVASDATNTPEAAETSKLQCRTRKSPRFLNSSAPSSPSTFSLLKSGLRISKSRCGICSESVKTGQGTAIFTAECGDSFHFPCIAAHTKKQGSLLTCPLCNLAWTEMHLLETDRHHQNPSPQQNVLRDSNNDKTRVFKVYNDDEPLSSSPTSGNRFNPILETEEDTDEFPGFSVSNNVLPNKITSRNVKVALLSEAVVVSVGKAGETHAVVLKLKAPAPPPIDLVSVIEVSRTVTAEKLRLMRKLMRMIVSSLSAADRLSIISFSTTSKRLSPLRRMTPAGRRSASRIIDAVVSVEGGAASAADSLKKAAKVIEDRSHKNPAATILLISECGPLVSSIRLSETEIPVHSVNLKAPPGDKFGKCITSLLRQAMQEVKVQMVLGEGEVSAVYSYRGAPAWVGSGSRWCRVGDLRWEEERELLVEMKVPPPAASHRLMSVRCSYKDPSTQQTIFDDKERSLLIPRPRADIHRLRNLFLTTRALAESRRMAERNDVAGALQILASARAMVLQSGSGEEFVRGLEAELAVLNWKRRRQDEAELLTPTSAWRAAERLAKLAIMRKSLNRISDLHGFENARF